MLVVDASIALFAIGVDGGFAELGDPDLVAPGLMWSETLSALHEQRWRGNVGPDDADASRGRLEQAPVTLRAPRGLRAEAWRIADELGLAKTYDAEYLALASRLGCRMVTADGRLRRGADRLGLAVLVSEL